MSSRKATSDTFEQSFIDEPIPPIRLKTVKEAQLTPEDLIWLFGPAPNSPRCVGIAPGYSESSGIPALALGFELRVLLILFHISKPRTSKDLQGRLLLEEELLCHPDCHLYAFDLAPLTLLLHLKLELHITEGIDIQSALPIKSRTPLASVQYVIGDPDTVYSDNITSSFDNLLYEPKQLNQLTQRAWLCAYIARIDTGDIKDLFYKAPKIDTKKLPDQALSFLEKLAHDSQQLDQMKPQSVTHDIKATWDDKKQQVDITSQRYQTRVHGKGQRVKVSVDSGSGGSFTLPGQTTKVNGKSSRVDTGNNLGGKAITSITTLGRGDPTQAQAQRTQLVLHMLQGRKPLLDDPWMQSIWLASDNVVWPESYASSPAALAIIPITPNPNYPINASQITAIEHMLSTSPDSRISLVQGPPGTGKTTVIATYVLSAIEAGQKGIWLMAQSNVAVKNIAEKLLNLGFTKWRLIVSQDFQFDWHEHLYHKLSKNTIRSDDFPKNRTALHKALDGAQVILCTLSMISNFRLRDLGFTTAVPVTSVVIDEASQIEIGDYVSLFNLYKTIRKVCFIGDDKQLPPFGTENIGTLQSIFEVEHLRKEAIFLDTQYRMPPQIGYFISKHVYNNTLQSNSLHPISSSTIACHFVDVSDGIEKHEGDSWKNLKEIEAVMLLAKHLQEEEKSYRIITPYEGQRSLLEEGLQKNNLDWHDKCFNVDSFQGNEDHYIIISLVRSKGLGFLNNLRRTNVMLTRCQRGMYICSSRAFLDKEGSKTLVGKMAAEMGANAWIEWKDLEGGNF